MNCGALDCGVNTVVAVASTPAVAGDMSRNPTVETVKDRQLEGADSDGVEVNDRCASPQNRRYKSLVTLDAHGARRNPAAGLWALRQTAL